MPAGRETIVVAYFSPVLWQLAWWGDGSYFLYCLWW